MMKSKDIDKLAKRLTESIDISVLEELDALRRYVAAINEVVERRHEKIAVGLDTFVEHLFDVSDDRDAWISEADRLNNHINELEEEIEQLNFELRRSQFTNISAGDAKRMLAGEFANLLAETLPYIPESKRGFVESIVQRVQRTAYDY